EVVGVVGAAVDEVVGLVPEGHLGNVGHAQGHKARLLHLGDGGAVAFGDDVSATHAARGMGKPGDAEALLDGAGHTKEGGQGVVVVAQARGHGAGVVAGGVDAVGAHGVDGGVSGLHPGDELVDELQRRDGVGADGGGEVDGGGGLEVQ